MRVIVTIFPIIEDISQSTNEGKERSIVIGNSVEAFSEVSAFEANLIDPAVPETLITLNGTFDNNELDSVVTFSLTKAQAELLTPKTYIYDAVISFAGISEPKLFYKGNWQITKGIS